MKDKQIKELFKSFVLPTYIRQGPVFVKGKESFLWDAKGRRYLDLFPGWGVGILGHAHPRIAKVLYQQAKELIHIPNNLYHPYQALLAKEIIKSAFRGRVFFANSGAEAVEGAIKLVRAWGKKQGRHKIIVMKNSFHGRTLGALSATAQRNYQYPFRPLLSGFKVAEFGNIESLKKQFDKKVAAVMLEVIQGEGGVNLAESEYFYEIKRFCQKHNLLLIFDEVQTGMGRTGKMFAFQNYGIEPDIFTLAKGLGAGFPISALVVKEKYAQVFSAGMHASTFGGSPLACRIGCEVFSLIREENILAAVRQKEKLLKKYFKDMQDKVGVIKEIRGRGLMWAIELKRECASVFNRAMEKGLIVNCTHKKIIRILPALNIKAELLIKGLDILSRLLKEL